MELEFFYIELSSQTLKILALDDNQIGSQGAWHLAKALETNRVESPFRLMINMSYSPIFQSLAVFNLQRNRIGDEGAIYLANVLQRNSVESPIWQQSTNLVFSILSCRHSRHLILEPMESLIEVYNLFLRH